MAKINRFMAPPHTMLALLHSAACKFVEHKEGTPATYAERMQFLADVAGADMCTIEDEHWFVFKGFLFEMRVHRDRLLGFQRYYVKEECMNDHKTLSMEEQQRVIDQRKNDIELVVERCVGCSFAQGKVGERCGLDSEIPVAMDLRSVSAQCPMLGGRTVHVRLASDVQICERTKKKKRSDDGNE